MQFEKIAIIGAGAWGSALAQMAARAGHETRLICQNEEHAKEINQTRKNYRFLGEQILSDKIIACCGFETVSNADMVLMVVPAQATPLVLEQIDPLFLTDKPVILCAKGLEKNTLLRQSEILLQFAPNSIPLVLSGPSFAKDVAAGLPTAVSLAGREKDLPILERVAKSLSGPTFRLYVNCDIIGVELAGALKNIYALACGAIEGAGLGLSARAAFIARADAEMGRLIVAMGGQKQSMMSLAGIGDLTLSCTSEQSRNYLFGKQLGKGKSKEQIIKQGAKLAEGVLSAPVALKLVKKYQIDAPLIEAVNLLLNNEANIEQLVMKLMGRELKREEE